MVLVPPPLLSSFNVPRTNRRRRRRRERELAMTPSPREVILCIVLYHFVINCNPLSPFPLCFLSLSLLFFCTGKQQQQQQQQQHCPLPIACPTIQLARYSPFLSLPLSLYPFLLDVTNGNLSPLFAQGPHAHSWVEERREKGEGRDNAECLVNNSNRHPYRYLIYKN